MRGYAQKETIADLSNASATAAMYLQSSQALGALQGRRRHRGHGIYAQCVRLCQFVSAMLYFLHFHFYKLITKSTENTRIIKELKWWLGVSVNILYLLWICLGFHFSRPLEFRQIWVLSYVPSTYGPALCGTTRATRTIGHTAHADHKPDRRSETVNMK